MTNQVRRRSFLLGGMTAGLTMAGLGTTAAASPARLSGLASMPAGPFEIVALLDVSPDGMPNFPNARYVVQRREISALEQAGDDVVLSYVVEPLRRTGQLDSVDGEVCLARGRGGIVSTIPTPGHTPGHQSVLVRGPGRQVVITGDVLVHAVQLAAPDVGYRFEADQDAARRTRRTLLDEAGWTPTWLATAHLTTPFLRADRCPL